MVEFRSVGAVLAAALMFAAGSSAAAPVVMISVDGMKPEYVLEADKRGLKIPFLRRLPLQGSYAEGVIGVWPTVTYPSHTTLVTGVSPAEHGIFANLEFDPEHHFAESWFWYAAQIRVPTLWQVGAPGGTQDREHRLAGHRGGGGRRLFDSGILADYRTHRNLESVRPILDRRAGATARTARSDAGDGGPLSHGQ